MKNEFKECDLVLVFKTNLTYQKDVERISTELDKQEGIIKWNVDLSDVDNVLRIESSKIQPVQIINIIAAAGYNCEELTD